MIVNWWLTLFWWFWKLVWYQYNKNTKVSLQYWHLSFLERSGSDTSAILSSNKNISLIWFSFNFLHIILHIYFLHITFLFWKTREIEIESFIKDGEEDEENPEYPERSSLRFKEYGKEDYALYPLIQLFVSPWLFYLCEIEINFFINSDYALSVVWNWRRNLILILGKTLFCFGWLGLE